MAPGTEFELVPGVQTVGKTFGGNLFGPSENSESVWAPPWGCVESTGPRRGESRGLGSGI